MTRTEGARIGVIGEDETDCATIRVLIRRLAGERTPVKLRFGGGCAEIFRKASAWMHELARAGCSKVIVVHDLDLDPRNGELNDERALRERLQKLPHPASLERLVCIPVEELEAWFWSDPGVLAKVARREVAAVTSPHTIRRPKEKLQMLSRNAGGAARYSTGDNERLAEVLDLGLCMARCPAFAALAAFVRAPG